MGGELSYLKGIENETINVILFNEDCKKCHFSSAANASLKKAIATFFTVSNNINYIVPSKEIHKKMKADKTPKFFLELDIETVIKKTETKTNDKSRPNGLGGFEQTTNVTESRSYIYYLILSKHRYNKDSGREMLKKRKFISAYRLGEVPNKKNTDMLDLIPLGIKVLNAHVLDGQKYKTLNPSIIASNNGRKQPINEIQIFRRFTSTRYRVLASVRAENNKREHLFHEAFKAPVKILGFNEILQKVYTQDPEENAVILTPNLDGYSSNKKIRGRNYYCIDLSTGKLMYIMHMKGLKFGYFGKKDLEKLGFALNSKYSTKKKRKK
jgi:hypothetical protein